MFNVETFDYLNYGHINVEMFDDHFNWILEESSSLLTNKEVKTLRNNFDKDFKLSKLVCNDNIQLNLCLKHKFKKFGRENLKETRLRKQ